MGGKGQMGEWLDLTLVDAAITLGQNVSPLYSGMLLCQAFSHLLFEWDIGGMDFLPSQLIHIEIPSVMLHILFGILSSQEVSGSWGQGNPEITSYAVLTLMECVNLPWVASLRPKILSS